MVLKIELRRRERPHEMQGRIKSRPKACLRVANAKVAFPSHSGIAYSAKVGSKNDITHMYKLKVRVALVDDLYICDGCDTKGVPDLTRSSGKHTAEHHLIRCLAPVVDEEDKASPTEQRLTSIESRLDDLTGRIGNIELLLHKLVAASESPAP
jgi:hypothetical protein